MNLKTFSETALGFIYPPLCFHCEEKISPGNYFLCFECFNSIKLFNRENDYEKEMLSRLLGKVPIESSNALYFYQDSSPLKTLIVELKYHYKPSIGVWLGYLLGKKIKKTSSELCNFTSIIPVPMVKPKLVERGYNQAEKIAIGIQKSFPHVPIVSEAILKRSYSISQTQKGKIERWLTQKDLYQFNEEPTFSDNLFDHVLIVDDILTTGSTIEAVSKAFLKDNTKQIKISIATIGITE